MKFFTRLMKAEFYSRPNRFVVEVRQGKKVFPAFLPNPGRLLELLLPGVPIFVEESSNPNRKYPFTVVGVEKKGEPVLLDTHKNNDVAEYLLKQEKIPGLKGWKIRQREYSLGRGKSRVDFLLEKGKKEMLLEVKSCTLFGEKVAMFPDAPSIRATRHIQEIAEEKGYAGGVLFLIHSSKPKWFLPDYHTDLVFAQTLLKLSQKIKTIPVALTWKSDMELSDQVKEVQIPWEVLKREAKDQGGYLLVLNTASALLLKGPRLGPFSIPKGFLVYVGSGQQTLSKRVARHKRKRKKKHWHIDYLLEKAEVIKEFLIRSQEDLECLLAKELVKKGCPIPTFGASDCSCNSHLIHFEENPVQKRWFQELLEYYQMDRLVKE